MGRHPSKRFSFQTGGPSTFLRLIQCRHKLGVFSFLHRTIDIVLPPFSVSRGLKGFSKIDRMGGDDGGDGVVEKRCRVPSPPGFPYSTYLSKRTCCDNGDLIFGNNRNFFPDHLDIFQAFQNLSDLLGKKPPDPRPTNLLLEPLLPEQPLK